jgi:hypothetical protein
MPRKQKKYHFIYKTTCSITGKYYVGMHSSDNLDDGYLGSGKILGYSRHKYGDENHTREILEYAESREQLRSREKEIVNEELLSDPLNINLKYGGEGGWDQVNLKLSKQHHIDNGRKGGKVGGFIGGKMKHKENFHNEAAKLKRQNTIIERYGSSSEYAVYMNKFITDESITKRKNKFQQNNHQKGDKNSQFGLKWIYSEELKISKKIKKSDQIPHGWKLGRKIKF